MNSSEALTLAKSGDSQAITFLLNRSLQPKGIAAKTSLKNGCLQVMLESPQVPDQKDLSEWLQKVLISLDSPVIHSVKLYGRQAGEDFPSWNQQFQLPVNSSQNLELQAQRGDIVALTKLLQSSLESQKVLVKLNLKDRELQALLESKNSPNQEICVDLVRQMLLELKVDCVAKVKLYGRETGEDLPDWHQEFELPPSATSINPSTERTPLLFAQAVKLTHERTGARILSCIDALHTSTGDVDKAVRLLNASSPISAKKEATPPMTLTTNVSQVMPLEPVEINLSEEDKIQCPRCKASQFSVDKRGFGLGKAATGAVLLGPVGLLGGFMGSDQVMVTCLKCGHQWIPKMKEVEIKLMGGFVTLFALFFLGRLIQYWYLIPIVSGISIAAYIYKEQVIIPEKINVLKKCKLVLIKGASQPYAIFLGVKRVKEKVSLLNQTIPNLSSVEIEKNKAFVAIPILSDEGEVQIEYNYYDIAAVEPLQPVAINKKLALRSISNLAPIIADCQATERESETLDKKYLEMTRLAGLVSKSDLYSNQLDIYERGLAQLELLLHKTDELNKIHMNLIKEALIANKVNEFEANTLSSSLYFELESRYKQTKEEYQNMKDTTRIYFDLVNKAQKLS